METAELVALYEAHMKKRNMNDWRWLVVKFNEFLTMNGARIERMERGVIERYLAGWGERKVSKSIVKHARKVIEELYLILEKEGNLESDALSGVRMEVHRKEAGFQVEFIPVRELGAEGEALLNLYEERMKERGDKPNTGRRKTSELRRWLLFLKERGTVAGEETENQVMEYFKQVTGKGTCGLSRLGTIKAAIAQFRRLVLAEKGRPVAEEKEIRIRKRNGYLPVLEERKKKREPAAGEKEALDACRNYVSGRGGIGAWIIRDVRDYFDWCAREGKDFGTADEPFLENYRNYLVVEKGEYSRITINRKLAAVRALYRILALSGRMARNSARSLRGIREGVQLPRNIIGVEEMGRFLGTLPDTGSPETLLIRAISELLYGCSIRISEAWALKLPDIDLKEGWVTITEMKNRYKRRRVPLSDRTRHWLKKYLAGGRERVLTAEELQAEKVFPKRKGSLMAYVNRYLVKQSERLTMKRITSHSFRHSAATHLLKAGAGIREVQAFLGHESIKSTQVYTRVVKEDLKKCIAAFHPRECEPDFGGPEAGAAGAAYEETDG